MLYSYTHMAAVGIVRLNHIERLIWSVYIM